MAVVPVINEQLAELNGLMAHQNLLISQLITPGSATPAAELAEIHHIVQSGEAPNVFDIGDQLMLNYNDGSNSYVLPWDIVHFDNVILEDGETVPGMFIQSHYAMQAVQFDASEAIYVAAAAMAPGTYHFTIGTNWGTNCVQGKSYQFTTTVEIPEGGVIVIGAADGFYAWGAPDQAPTNWKAYTFATNASVTPLDNALALTEGTGGTDLGTLASNIVAGTTNPNNLQRAAYGYNRWRDSAMRQFLNSDALAGAWWSAKNTFDRPPKQLATLRGFKKGFDDAFLNIIKPVQVKTLLNTITDGASSNDTTHDTTYDTFFLPALYQEYIVPQVSSGNEAIEGDYWEYWKQRLGLSSPQVTGAPGTNINHIRYGYDAKASAQACRLRSAGRGYASNAWGGSASGSANHANATYANRGCPACVIC